MATATAEQIHVALRGDLKKAGSKGFTDLVNDVARKTFVARNADAIYEFSHKQPEAAFWSGVKYYSSGKQSRIRFRRTPPKPKSPKGAPAAADSVAEAAS